MHPILLHIGPLAIRVWGLMLGLGVLAGVWLSVRLAGKHKINGEHVLDFTVYAIIAGILGARAWEVLFSWERFATHPLDVLKFWEGGLSIQGAVAGGLLVFMWYSRKHQLPVLTFADVLAPGLILGQAIGRIGCFFNGDAYGIPTSAWFGVVYQPGTPAYNAFGGLSLVPAELFEAFGDFAILGILLYILPRRPFSGFVTGLYFILYPVLRFGLEFWRADSLLISGSLKAAQVTGLATAVLAIGFLFYLWWQNQQMNTRHFQKQMG